MVKRLNNLNTVDISNAEQWPLHITLTQIYIVFVCGYVYVRMVGGVVVGATLSSGDASMHGQHICVSGIAAVCTASSRFLLENSISSLTVSPHMASLLRPSFSSLLLVFFVLFLWLYLTALNCCSLGCFFFSFLDFFLFFFEYVVELWVKCQPLKTLWNNQYDEASPSFAVLTWKLRGKIFLLSTV